MDDSVPALWRCWQNFVRGKKRTEELEAFRFHLEKNLMVLHHELQSGTYRHGGYRAFSVNDPKRREIAVASTKDRFVHRLLYEYLVDVYDKTFIDDVWSCREGKGLLGAIERAQTFLYTHRDGWFWRADIHKFFDTVDQRILITLLRRRVQCPRTLRLLEKIIGSYAASEKAIEKEERERESLLNDAASPSATSRVRCLRTFTSTSWIAS